jgi:hypothetical protein
LGGNTGAQISKAIKSISNKAKKGLQPTLYLHSSIALCLNLLALLAS